MNWAKVIYHRTRISDSKSIFFFYTADGVWLLDKNSPDEKASIPPYRFILQSWKDLLPRFRIFSQPANSRVLPAILVSLTKGSLSLLRIKF